MLLGRQFLTIMYRPEYAMYPSVFTWLMAAAGVSYVASALGFGLAAARKFDVQLLVYICAALVTTAASVPLVPRYGLQGAAWALLAGMLTWCAGFALALTYTLRPQGDYLQWGRGTAVMQRERRMETTRTKTGTADLVTAMDTFNCAAGFRFEC